MTSRVSVAVLSDRIVECALLFRFIVSLCVCFFVCFSFVVVLIVLNSVMSSFVQFSTFGSCYVGITSFDILFCFVSILSA